MKKKKQIFAWIGILLLGGLYLATLIFALIGSSWAFDMFKICLGFTIAVPVLLYACQMLAKLSGSKDDKNKKTEKEQKK